MSKLRVFIAASLDGFIAGPNDELDWLPGHSDIEDTFTPFMAQIGALLMGRRTYDVVCSLPDPWAYGDTPVLVPTSRPLTPLHNSIRAVQGSIEEVVTAARQAAAGRDVYVDGGTLIRSALDAGLIDEIALTTVPVILGAGIPLFAGSTHRRSFTLRESRHIGGGLVQSTYVAVR
jgi:dihydrofolate reductase